MAPTSPVTPTVIVSVLVVPPFCEYILPYRINIEPLQDWRIKYEQSFRWVSDSIRNTKGKDIAKYLIKDINNWFTSIYEFEKRTEPIPRLGALQVLLRKKGYCEDVAALAAFALRSQGVSASMDMVPFWGTSSGGHSLNFSEKKNHQKVRFDILFNYSNMSLDSFQLVREPGKVFRQTYSNQKNAIASFTDSSNIPQGILRSHNILDVTDEYWNTSSFSASLKNMPNGRTPNFVYACVLNYQNWEPVWWGRRTRENLVLFSNMSRGVVYLPQYYSNNKLIPAGYPVALGYNHITVLKPDMINKRNIKMPEEENYLLYQTGKKYHLLCWDGSWKLISTKIANEKATSLSFENVPRNALLLLLPEYSKGKERPFIITDDSKRIWF